MVDIEPQTIQQKWETAGIPKLHPKIGLSFGSYLEMLRKERNLNQANVVQPLGISGTSVLSYIESGKKEITRAFAERVSQVFGLDEIRRSELLKVGGFLPSDQDVNTIAQLLDPNDLCYPESLLDFGGRILCWNRAYVQALGLEYQVEQLKREQPNMLEFIFDPTWKMRERLSSHWEQFAMQETSIFYTDQVGYGLKGIRWYELLMMRLFSLPDFKKVWNEIADKGYSALLNTRPLVGNLQVQTNEGQPNSYRIIRSPVPIDDRLTLVTYLPQSSFSLPTAV